LQLGLRSFFESGEEAEEVEPWQRAHTDELEVFEKGAKTRKRTSEELSFPTIKEINQGYIWG
jgi:predicted ribonuclease YlaK